MPEEPEKQNPVNNTPPSVPARQNAADDAMLQAVAEVEKEPQPGPSGSENTETGFINNPASGSLKRRGSKKKLIIGIVAIVLLLVAGGGTAFALWYNHPDKVSEDAVKNLVNSKTMINQGSYSLKDSQSKSNLDITFKSQSDIPKYAGSLDVDAKINYQDLSLNFSGAGMMSESGAIYFKLNNAGELVDKALETDYGKLYARSPELQGAIKKFVAKIDNKWVGLDKSDLAVYSDSFQKERTCYQKALGAFYDDQSQQNQVVDAYKANRFITVKDTGESQIINGQDSASYEVGYSVREADEFNKAIKKTKVSASLEKCGDSASRAQSDRTPTKQEQENAQKEANKVKTIVWISRFSHQLTKIEASSSDKNTTTEFKADFKPNENLQLSDPKNFIKAKDLQKDLEELSVLAGAGASSSRPPVASEN